MFLEYLHLKEQWVRTAKYLPDEVSLAKLRERDNLFFFFNHLAHPLKSPAVNILYTVTTVDLVLPAGCPHKPSNRMSGVEGGNLLIGQVRSSLWLPVGRQNSIVS